MLIDVNLCTNQISEKYPLMAPAIAAKQTRAREGTFCSFCKGYGTVHIRRIEIRYEHSVERMVSLEAPEPGISELASGVHEKREKKKRERREKIEHRDINQDSEETKPKAWSSRS